MQIQQQPVPLSLLPTAWTDTEHSFHSQKNNCVALTQRSVMGGSVAPSTKLFSPSYRPRGTTVQGQNAKDAEHIAKKLFIHGENKLSTGFMEG